MTRWSFVVVEVCFSFHPCFGDLGFLDVGDGFAQSNGFGGGLIFEALDVERLVGVCVFNYCDEDVLDAPAGACAVQVMLDRVSLLRHRDRRSKVWSMVRRRMVGVGRGSSTFKGNRWRPGRFPMSAGLECHGDVAFRIERDE